jgi:hypothetical protein
MASLQDGDEVKVGEEVKGHAGDADPLRGLTSEEVAARLLEHGKNEIPEDKQSWHIVLLKQVGNLSPDGSGIWLLTQVIPFSWAWCCSWWG